MPLEDDKLEALRRWGRGLRDAGSEEQAASGRAILMLIEEVDRLRLELVRMRELWSREDPASDETAADTGGPLPSTLRRRVQQSVGRDPGGERAATSPEAWIESLRRQE